MTAVPREDQGASATARRSRTSRGSRWCGTRLAELAARVVDSAVTRCCCCCCRRSWPARPGRPGCAAGRRAACGSAS